MECRRRRMVFFRRRKRSRSKCGLRKWEANGLTKQPIPKIGWAEELGSGVRNIVKYSKVYSGTTPEFIDGDVFKTKIFLNGINRSDVGVNVGVKFSETEREVLECIKENGEFSAEQIAEKIKRGKRTVERAIKSLKEHGVIERVGSDKAGRWKVVN